jgi:hypothetical protein
MKCPFYGRAAMKLTNAIVPQGGNQCALVISAYAPCYMEALHQKEPDAEACELLVSVESRYEWERRVAAGLAKRKIPT